MKRILRYTITVDGDPKEVPAGVPVLFGRAPGHGHAGLEHLLDVWFEIHVPGHDWDPTTYEPPKQWVQAIGTGRPIPDGWRWLASVVDGPGVWHLYNVRPDPA